MLNFYNMCVNPRLITLHNSNNPYHVGRQTISVPCGKCYECLKKYQNDWTIRLIEESKSHKYMLFFTLTYDDSNIPKVVDKVSGEVYYSVYKPHVQSWFKRFRERYHKKFNRRFTGKYFITSEYGPKTFRPHYHGIVFGINLHDFISLALNDWRQNFGFFTARSVNLLDYKSNFNSCRYLAKYCSKGQFEYFRVKERKVLPNFKLISKSLGLSYVEKNKNFHLGTDKFNYFKNENDYLEYLVRNYSVAFQDNNGKIFNYSMPRYYKDKIYSNDFTKTKIADYIRKMHDDLYIQQLAFIQSQRNCSFNEALNLYSLQEFETKRQRNSDAKKQLFKFYEKSRF